MIDHGHIQDARLSEYLDGGLPEPERLEIETHLASCDSCARLADELREVIAHAHQLETPAPAADLWPGIEARLTTRVHPIARWFRGGNSGPLRISFTIPQLAAAAAALIVFSGAGAWWMASRAPMNTGAVAVNRGAAGPLGTAAPNTTSTQPAIAPAGTGSAPVTRGSAQNAIMTAGFDESRYQVAIDELTQVLRTHRDQLDPLTVKVLEENLATIDRAITSARKALEADPGSGYLSGHLAQQLELKVWLLRRAADVVAAAQG